MKFFLYSFGLVLFAVIKLASSQLPGGCPVADDPSNLARCIQVDISAIVSAAKGSNDFTAFCALASRYMECFKTYTRGCVGGFIGEGTFNELINTAYYCCNGVTASQGCPFNPNVNRRCIDGEANVAMSDGTFKQVKYLEIGDKVKTLDQLGNLIDTDVIMMLDFQNHNQEYLFLNITTESKKSIKVSVEHLMAISNNEFKLARNLNRGDSIVTYDLEKKEQLVEKIESILIEPVMSYAAPLTLSGTLLANDVLASSYALIENHDLAHMSMAPLRWWYHLSSLINQATPNVLPPSLQFEKQLNGTHWYPNLLHSFTQQYLTSVIKL